MEVTEFPCLFDSSALAGWHSCVIDTSGGRHQENIPKSMINCEAVAIKQSNALAVVQMLVWDQCDAQMVSLLHFARSPLLPYECVCAACKYSFCISDDIRTALKDPGAAAGDQARMRSQNVRFGSKMSIEGCKKGIFPTGRDGVAPFVCNGSKSVMH